MPDLAVVVPVYRDAAGLRETFAAIDALDERSSLTVIVAVDGPQPDVEVVARAGADEVVVLGTNQGSYAARNAALDALAGRRIDAVLFTDAGCRPQPGWVAGHREALETFALSGGAIRMTVDGRVTPAAYLDRLWHLAQDRYVATQSFAATANLAVRAAVVDVVRFDSTRRSGGDRDFCRRAVGAGFPIGYAASALVEHDARSTRHELEHKVSRIAEGIAVTDVDDLPPTPPDGGARAALRLLRGAFRAGAVRSPGDVAELLALDRFRRRTVLAALDAARSRRDVNAPEVSGDVGPGA